MIALGVLAFLLAFAAFVAGIMIGMACMRPTIRDLRAALVDAYSYCIRCAGDGVIATPGATLRCPTCRRWRRIVERSSEYLH